MPPLAQTLLREAAQVGTPGSLARLVAVDAAQQRIRELFPDLFHSSVEPAILHGGYSLASYAVKRGRPRKYANNLERQRAYYERSKPPRTRKVFSSEEERKQVKKQRDAASYLRRKQRQQHGTAQGDPASSQR